MVVVMDRDVSVSTIEDATAALTSPADCVGPSRGKTTKWVTRSRDVIAAKPEMPGVWRRRDGGFHVRARVKDPRTGKMREVDRALPDVTKAREAFNWLQAELDKIRSGSVEASEGMPQFHKYAVDVFERKVALGKIRSALGRAKWDTILKTHLIPAFGDLFVDQIRPSDIKAWQAKIAARIKSGKMAPATANTILAVLKQILSEAVDEFDLKDPMRGIENFDTRGHVTYTEEEPNALAPSDVPRFLAAMRTMHPRHYAITVLGFATGLRPSSMRPLRRSGATPDLRLAEGVLLVRRSHTEGDEVMETTKTDRHQRLLLPASLVDILKWHCEEVLTRRKERYSELLFPKADGGFRSRWSLRKAFAEVATAIKLPYTFTPRGMRRTYQDLSRAAGIKDVVTRAISGHATEAMQRHYSTVGGEEIREAMAKIIDLATAREAIEQKKPRRRQAGSRKQAERTAAATA
jgi:hypothetical protein